MGAGALLNRGTDAAFHGEQAVIPLANDHPERLAIFIIVIGIILLDVCIDTVVFVVVLLALPELTIPIERVIADHPLLVDVERVLYDFTNLGSLWAVVDSIHNGQIWLIKFGSLHQFFHDSWIIVMDSFESFYVPHLLNLFKISNPFILIMLISVKHFFLALCLI